MEYKFTTGRTIPAILVYFLAFLAGDLLSSLACDLIFSFVTLPASELYLIVRAVASLLLTLLFFWLCTVKWLRRKWRDFGITSDAPLLTGAGFGVEASLIAIAGYALACLALLWILRKDLRR